MRNGNFMQLASGRLFWPADPRPEEIFIEDIAAALSRQCRYAGHLRDDAEHYSVAQHCCHVCDACAPGYELWGLLHDASEAYLVDVPRPIKGELGGYAQLEFRLMACISERFDLIGFTVPAHVKRLDNAILANERRDVMAPMLAPVTNEAWGITEPPIPDLRIECWPASLARYEFLRRFERLTQQEA